MITLTLVWIAIWSMKGVGASPTTDVEVDQQSAAVKEADLIRYAKNIDVHLLDSDLASQQLEYWLLKGPAHAATLEWRESDCDIKPDGPEPEEGWPLCVKAIMGRSGNKVPGWLVLTVGTTKAGIEGPPRLRYGVLIRKIATPWGPFVDVGRLSNLPYVISRVEQENLRAAYRRAEDNLWLYRLDPKTEVAFSDRDRTDMRFFHGLAILATAQAFDPELRAVLARLADSAKTTGARRVVRDGDFGLHVALNGATITQDVIVCFHCRPTNIRFLGGAGNAERESRLTSEQERLLRNAFARYGHW